MGKTALFGAGGAIGTSVAAALRERGEAYRVVGRSRAALEAAFAGDRLAEIVSWDPGNPASVRAAANGIDTIVYLVGVPYDKFAEHPVLMRATLEGAIAQGVARLVLIGTVYPYGVARTTSLREDHPREPHTFKGRMRKAQEDLALEADAAGRIRATVLRLPDFFGPTEKSFLYGAFRAALEGKTAQLVGPIDVPHQYAFTADAGPIVAALRDQPAAYGRTWHFAGSGTIAQRELVRRIFAAAGTPMKTQVVGKTALRALGLFNPLMRELVEMHYLQTTPVIMNDDALRALLPDLHATPWDDAIHQTLEALRTTRDSLPDAATLRDDLPVVQQ